MFNLVTQENIQLILKLFMLKQSLPPELASDIAKSEAGWVYIAYLEE